MACGLQFVACHVVPGGVGGIVMISNHLFRTTIGLVIFLLNVPLFVVGIRVIGRAYGVKSVLGVAIRSLFVDGLTYVVHVRLATDNKILGDFGRFRISVEVLRLHHTSYATLSS